MLTKGLASLVILAAMASVVISFVVAIPLEPQEASPITTAGPTNTYFGVDANDKEAVAKKQSEMSHEKWRQMMGDVDIEGIDFSPKLANPLDFLKSIFNNQEQVEGFGKAIKGIAEKVSKALTEGPHAEEIRKHLNETFFNI